MVVHVILEITLQRLLRQPSTLCPQNRLLVHMYLVNGRAYRWRNYAHRRSDWLAKPWAAETEEIAAARSAAD
jgi:hypothetical protein